MDWWLPGIPVGQRILRSRGIFDLDKVRAAVLEPSDQLNVLKLGALRPTEPSH